MVVGNGFFSVALLRALRICSGLCIDGHVFYKQPPKPDIVEVQIQATIINDA